MNRTGWCSPGDAVTTAVATVDAVLPQARGPLSESVLALLRANSGRSTRRSGCRSSALA